MERPEEVNKALEQRIAKPRRSRGRTRIVDRSPQPAEELELSPALRVAMTDYASEVAARAAEYARLRDK